MTTGPGHDSTTDLPATGALAPARVHLYSREGCHLCDDARAVVREVCDAAGESWAETDVDTDPALRAEHGEHVPVVTVDGVQQGFWRVDAGRLARAIARGRGRARDVRR